MKANELRIGNYVYQGEKYKESKVTSYELYNFDTKQKGGAVAEYYKDWKPIQLTEEWLLKFGFEKHFSGDSIIEYKSRIWYKKNKWYLGGTRINNIQYVHQLQNIYFALTGKELTYANKTI